MTPLRILAVAVAIAVVWLILRTRYAFVVQVSRDRVRCTRGKAPPVFVEEVSRVCHDAGVAKGWLAAVSRGDRLALRFSRSFPPEVQQRLRNAWVALPSSQQRFRGR